MDILKNAMAKVWRKNIRKAAIKYAAKGYKVVLLHSIKDGRCSCGNSKCTRPGKHPLTAHGIKDATSDIVTLKNLLKMNRFCNIGIATGRANGLIVLDVDRKNSGFASFKAAKLKFGKLGSGPKVITGGGLHQYFLPPPYAVKRDTAGKRFGRGVDVIADDSYVVVPPSMHASGSSYEWIEGRDLLSGAPPKRLPSAWEECLKPKSAKAPVVVVPSKSELDTVKEGGRNSALMSYAGTLARNGMDADAMCAALLVRNQKICEPPLSENEVETIAASASRYREEGTALDANDPAPSLLKMVLASHFKGGEHLIYVKGVGFFQYIGTHWVQVNENDLPGVETVVMDVIEQIPSDMRPKTGTLLKETMHLMEVDRSRQAFKLDLSGRVHRSPVINCKNCEVWLKDDGSVETKPHSENSYLLNVLDVNYDPTATCPEYDKALLDIFSETSKPKAMKRHWNELFGYVVQPWRSIPVIALLLGEGNNGKSKLMELITIFLGNDGYIQKPVATLDGNQFSLSGLVGKLLFYDDDVKAGTKLPDGILKMMSEGKPITSEKKYRDQFTFINRAIPILLCNNLPSTADVSKGLRRRIQAFPFDHTFEEGKDLDLTLFDRIRQNEMSGVLNRALAGLQRLRKRGKFKVPLDVRQASKAWFEKANPIPGFLADCTVKDGDGRWLQSEMYEAFNKWLSENNVTFVTQLKNFTERVKQQGYAIKHCRNGMTVFGLKKRTD